MKQHLDLVGLLYMIAGAMSALVALAIVALGLGALSMARADGPLVAPRLVGAAFLALALLLLVWAAVNVWVGRGLRRARPPFARLAAFGVAILHLFVLPFGTALGVYGLWVLVHPEVRARFEDA
jgi:hypothetical protein